MESPSSCSALRRRPAASGGLWPPDEQTQFSYSCHFQFDTSPSSQHAVVHAEACLAAHVSLSLCVCLSVGSSLNISGCSWSVLTGRLTEDCWIFSAFSFRTFDGNQKQESVQVHWRSNWNHTTFLFAVRSHIKKLLDTFYRLSAANRSWKQNHWPDDCCWPSKPKIGA